MTHTRRRLLAGAAIAAGLAAAVVLLAWWPRHDDASARADASQVETPAARAQSAVAATPGASTRRDAAVALVDAEAFVARIVQADAQPLAAWRRLLALWQLPDTDADVRTAATCAPVLAPGVYCVRGRAALDGLAALGRPALLRLREDGRDAWALLLGLDAQRARLWLGDARIDVDRVALAAAWSGDYAALWRAPDGLVVSMRPGTSGAAIDWVRARLVPDRPARAGAPFDAALADEVRRFQRAHGLVADGVVGRETLFALAADAPGPRLVRTLD